MQRRLFFVTFTFTSDLTVTVTVSSEELVQWAQCGSDANVGSSVGPSHAENVRASGRYNSMS